MAIEHKVMCCSWNITINSLKASRRFQLMYPDNELLSHINIKMKNITTVLETGSVVKKVVDNLTWMWKKILFMLPC